MTIKAHCMGAEFPKRLSGEQIARCMKQALDNHIAKSNTEPDGDSFDRFIEGWAKRTREIDRSVRLPSAADLDAVAEEQRVKEKTGMYYDKDGWYPPS